MITDQFWAGSELSYHAVAKAYEMRSQASEMDAPSLYQRQGSVGVINIQGSLIPGDAGWLAMFGLTGYDNIRGAIAEGLADKEATSLMLNIGSGGGAVTGMTDAANFISQAGKIKPITAYAENAASAAYRLAVETSHITVADTGIVGSIGVLRLHTEYSKANEMAGVKTTVLRAGEFKALINPVEPLTEAALNQEQAKLDHLYTAFSKSVEKARGLSKDHMDKVAGQGREFIGKMGVDAGLADKVGGYEQALRTAENLAKNPKDTKRVAGTLASTELSAENVANNPLGNDMKLTFTPEQLLAIAGTEVEATTTNVVDTTPATENMQAAVDTPNIDTEVVVSLKAELSASQVAVTEAQAAVSTLTAELEALKATTASMHDIVLSIVTNMTVALGGKKDTHATLTSAELAAEYPKTSQLYASKFKVGGVAATAPIEEKPTPKNVVPFNPMFAALSKSTNAK